MSKELAGKMAFVTGSNLRARRRRLLGNLILLAASVSYREIWRAAQARSLDDRVDRKFGFYGQGPLENQATSGMQAAG